MINRAIICVGLLALPAATASQAQDLGARPLRYGNTSGWYYDNRDDIDFRMGGKHADVAGAYLPPPLR